MNITPSIRPTPHHTTPHHTWLTHMNITPSIRPTPHHTTPHHTCLTLMNITPSIKTTPHHTTPHLSDSHEHYPIHSAYTTPLVYMKTPHPDEKHNSQFTNVFHDSQINVTRFTNVFCDSQITFVCNLTNTSYKSLYSCMWIFGTFLTRSEEHTS